MAPAGKTWAELRELSEVSGGIQGDENAVRMMLTTGHIGDDVNNLYHISAEPVLSVA